MTESYTVVFLEELNWLVLTCPARNCGTAVEFDFEKRAPSKCPSCGQDFGSIEEGIHEAIASYREFHRKMTSFGLKPRFRIRIDAKPA